jgi:hypothetical protein
MIPKTTDPQKPDFFMSSSFFLRVKSYSSTAFKSVKNDFL